jgi:hypothetical protein
MERFIVLGKSFDLVCVFIEKKYNKNAYGWSLKYFFLLSLASAQKKEMIEAEKSAIVNQILYVVKNMIIFEFT